MADRISDETPAPPLPQIPIGKFSEKEKKPCEQYVNFQ
jgi:hypothetical protein